MAISKVILNGTTQIDLTQDTVTAADMRNGVTAHGADGLQKTGSVQTQAGKTVTPTTYNQTAVSSQRITTGNVIVAGDSDLQAGNIKDGVEIFGVMGTYSGGGGGGGSLDYADIPKDSYMGAEGNLCIFPEGWDVSQIYQGTLSSAIPIISMTFREGNTDATYPCVITSQTSSEITAELTGSYLYTADIVITEEEDEGTVVTFAIVTFNDDWGQRNPTLHVLRWVS